MDSLPATWSTQMEFDDPVLNHIPQEMKPSIDQPTKFISFSNPQVNTSEAQQIPGIIARPPGKLTFCNSRQNTFQKPYSSSPLPTQFVSFGDPYSLNPIANKNDKFPKFATEADQAELSDGLMSFGTKGFSSTSTTPSALQEQRYQFRAMEDDHRPQTQKSGGGSYRTPLEAKYHVMAERKRREELSQRFISLSTLVPGLKKLDKTSVMDGAMDHLKQLQNRLKTVKEGKKMEAEESVLAGQNPSCLCYCYEGEGDFSASNIGENFKTSFELKIFKGNSLLNVTCKYKTGFQESLLSEMQNLGLSVTGSVFMPFGDDNMLAISIVAKMKEGFCVTEEELANSILRVILKLI